MAVGFLRFCIAPLALACGCAFAQAPRGDDLMQLLRSAQQRDAAYIAARQSLLITQQRFGVARGLPPGASTGMDGAPARLRQARERFRMAEQDLALRVAQAYFATAAARQDADLALAQLNLMAQQLRTALRTDAAGAAGRDAQQRFDQARAVRVAATRDLEQRRSELERLAGRAPEALKPLAEEATLWSPKPEDAGYWASKANEDHPRVRMQQAVLDAMGEEVVHRREGAAPGVDVTASRNRIFGEDPSLPAEVSSRARSSQLGLVFTMPLADSGPESQAREALVEQERTEAALAAERGVVSGRARLAFANVVQSLARCESLTALAKTGRGALELAQNTLRAGARLPADLLASVQQAFNDQRALSRARSEALVQGLALKAAAGTLEERDVADANALLAAAAPPPPAAEPRP